MTLKDGGNTVVYLFAILIGVGIIWTVYFISNRSTNQKPNPTYPQFKNNEEMEEQGRKKSLDRIFAENNNMWVCRRCETLNRNGSISCGACGATRWK